jgi:hypothetical protein
MLGKIIFIAAIGMIISQFVLASNENDTTDTETVNQRRRYAPHYIPIQYAGNVGFLSTGVGYVTPRDKSHFSFQYGFAPASIAGIQIHTLTFRNVFHLYKYNVNESTFIPYVSLGLSLEVGGRSFFFLPSNMPKSYYKFPKSIHLIPAIGLKLRRPTKEIKALRAVELFAEATTVDAYIWYKTICKEVRMTQIVSLSIGVNLIRR